MLHACHQHSFHVEIHCICDPWSYFLFMYFGCRSESLLNAATCDIPTSSPAAVWQLADFKITAQRLFDQGRASATLCLRLISTHLLPFYPYSLSNVHIPWCHFLLSFRIRDIWLHMPPSKRFRCCSGVSSYNPSFFFVVFFLRHQWVCVLSLLEWRDMCGWSEPVLLCLRQRLVWSHLSEPRANM